MFRRYPDRCEMTDSSFIRHHENKAGYFPSFSNGAITEGSRLVEKIRKRVLSVIFTILEAANVEPQKFIEIIGSERSDLIRRLGSGDDILRFARFRRYEEVA